MHFILVSFLLLVSVTRLGLSSCYLLPFVMDKNEQDGVVSVDGWNASFSGFISAPETDDEIVVKVPKPAKIVKQSSERSEGECFKGKK